MAKKEQTPRKTPSGEWIYITISAAPQEREAYRKIAGIDSRSVSWWIRDVLNKEVARRLAQTKEGKVIGDEKTGEVPGGEGSAVPLETVSTDRA